MNSDKNSDLLHFAKVYSILFHPMVIPSLGVAIVLFGNSYLNLLPFRAKFLLLGIVVLNTLLIPAFAIFLLYKFRIIKNLTLENQNERVLPLIVVIISYLMCVYAVANVNIEIVTRMLFAAIFALILTTLLNFYWKVSLHSTAMGGLIGMLLAINLIGFGYMPVTMMIFIVLAGILGSLRLYMGRHNLAQVGAGFLIGASATIAVLYV